MFAKVTHQGSFDNIEKFLKAYNREKLLLILYEYGQIGVSALSDATPVNTGDTALSWEYKVIIKKNSINVTWMNHCMDNALVSVAILVQYGHLSKKGVYTRGIDFINPAMKPVFDQIGQSLWEEVTKI